MCSRAGDPRPDGSGRCARSGPLQRRGCVLRASANPGEKVLVHAGLQPPIETGNRGERSSRITGSSGFASSSCSTSSRRYPSRWTQAIGQSSAAVASLFGFYGIGEIGEDGGHVSRPPDWSAYPTSSSAVASGHDTSSIPRGVFLSPLASFEIAARDELHLDLAACEGASVRLEHHLKALRPVMGGAVKLGRAQQRHVIRLFEVFHQRRDELLGGEALEAAAFGWNDHVEAADGMRDVSAAFEPSQRCPRGHGGRAERAYGLVGRKKYVPREARSVMYVEARMDSTHAESDVSSCFSHVSSLRPPLVWAPSVVGRRGRLVLGRDRPSLQRGDASVLADAGFVGLSLQNRNLCVHCRPNRSRSSR